jgi:hypothetical protein
MDYSNISKYIGEKNWNDSITHDSGQFAANGGGKSSLHLSQPGQGKSTLLCYEAQMSKCLHVSKIDFIKDLLAKNDLSPYAGKIFLETVLWRIRDLDSCPNIIAQNWWNSFKGRMGATKEFHLWVHERDINKVLFYSYNHKRQEICIKNLPAPHVYKDSQDLMKRLRWGCVNAILEPQSYTLSPTLIQRLREKKMDISEDAERDEEYKKAVKSKTPGRKSKKSTKTSYENREVSPSYFWFDMIHTARKMNKYRHLHFILDEIDDVFEPRSEGDVWKLIDMVAGDWKDLRKANISTSLATHETDFIDWRILKRIDYFYWMAGASVHNSYSMLKIQNLVSDLPIGTFLVERRKMDFGINTFEKIPLGQPAMRVDGLKGETFNIPPKACERILKQYEESWSVVTKDEGSVPLAETVDDGITRTSEIEA